MIHAPAPDIGVVNFHFWASNNTQLSSTAANMDPLSLSPLLSLLAGGLLGLHGAPRHLHPRGVAHPGGCSSPLGPRLGLPLRGLVQIVPLGQREILSPGGRARVGEPPLSTYRGCSLASSFNTSQSSTGSR